MSSSWLYTSKILKHVWSVVIHGDPKFLSFLPVRSVGPRGRHCESLGQIPGANFIKFPKPCLFLFVCNYFICLSFQKHDGKVDGFWFLIFC